MVGEGEVNFLVFFSVFSSRRNSLEGVRAESSSRGGGGGRVQIKKWNGPMQYLGFLEEFWEKLTAILKNFLSLVTNASNGQQKQKKYDSSYGNAYNSTYTPSRDFTDDV